MVQEHVFLVEDDEKLREIIADLLRRAGYMVRVWNSADAFLSEMPYEEPAMLITDMCMPGRSGAEMHAELDRLGHRIPVTYISGESTVAQSVQAMKLGPVEFLIKPFGREELLDAVKKSIDKHRQEIRKRAAMQRYEQLVAELSPREKEVHQLMLQGLSNQEIMKALSIALPTVKQYKTQVLRKFGIHSLSQLIRLSRPEAQ